MKLRNQHCTGCALDMGQVRARATDGVYEDALQICVLSECPRNLQPIGDQDVPIKRGEDSKGPYYQWGSGGKKYRYTSGNRSSRESAKRQAQKQSAAARASGYKGK